VRKVYGLGVSVVTLSKGFSEFKRAFGPVNIQIVEDLMRFYQA